MFAAEFFALMGILVGVTLGGRAIVGAIRNAGERRVEYRARRERMRDDLRTALAAHDYHKLDDFLALWGDLADAKMKAHVKTRRDQLYVED